MYEIVVEKSFAAAHFLPEYPGKCRNLHGHNYHVRVYLRGSELNRFGMLADFGAVKSALDFVLERFDHRCLNELPEFADTAPSTEHLAHRIAEAMQRHDFAPAKIHRVEVWETSIQAATYYVE